MLLPTLYTPQRLARESATLQTRITKEWKGHRGRVQALRWSADGRRLASSASDHTARVWQLDLQSGYTRKTVDLRGHMGSVDQLAWHPATTAEDWLATASADRTVRLWDLKENGGKSFQTLPTPGENINVCWSPDGTRLAVGNKHDVLSVFDTRTWKELTRRKYDVEVNEFTWDATGRYLFLTCGDGTVRMLDGHLATNLEEQHRIRAHTANCYCIEMDPSQRYFAVGSADTLVSLWDLQDLICLRTFGELDWPVRTLSFSHEGTLLAMASEDHWIAISDVESGALVHRVKCFAATNAVAWHPKRLLLAFAGDEVDATKRDLGNLRIFGFPAIGGGGGGGSA